MCDTGTADGIEVREVKNSEDGIIHITSEKLREGSKVFCRVDREQRISRMETHTGEHIISALMLRMFGLNNVGFHMGESGTTADFDGAVSDSMISDLEAAANKAVRDNMPVTVSYPSPDELKTLEYRSKLDLDSGVRIVTIGDIDKCACCAPHLPFTGMIGAIRIADCKSYKGGVRLTLECGKTASGSARLEHIRLREISAALSASPDRAINNLEKLFDEIKELKYRNTCYSDRMNEMILNAVADSSDAEEGRPIFIADVRNDRIALRRLALGITERTGCAVCVMGGGGELVISAVSGVRGKFSAMASCLKCRGGGSDTLADASLPPDTDADTVKSVFSRIFA